MHSFYFILISNKGPNGHKYAAKTHIKYNNHSCDTETCLPLWYWYSGSSDLLACGAYTEIANHPQRLFDAPYYFDKFRGDSICCFEIIAILKVKHSHESPREGKTAGMFLCNRNFSDSRS